MNTNNFMSLFSFGRIGRQLLAASLLAWLVSSAVAQENPPPPPPPAVEQETPATPPATDESLPSVEAEQKADDGDFDFDFDTDFDRRRGRDHSVIVRFDDSNVAAHETVDAVVSIGGSSTTAGTVREGVVSIFGNTHVTGPVGDVAVAVFGNAYVNSRVRGDVVAVFGDVELGPEARVGGEVIVVSGVLKSDPAAEIRRGTQQVTLPFDFGRFQWLKPWIKHCALMLRPLALEPGLGWAWGLALGFLTLYVLIAVMFSTHVEKCVTTMETRPGPTIVASLLTLILTPVLTLVLTATVLGVALVPFFWIALFIAGIFGHAAILAALGRRLTRFVGASGPVGDFALAVVVGGVIMLALYIIPVIGLIAYKTLGILSLGVVVYTLLLAAQKKREETATIAAAAAASAAPAASMTAADASVASPQAETAGPAPASEPAPAIPDSALPRAGFWIRMGALLIDMILIGIICGILSDGDNDLFLPVLATYGAVMWKLKGTTVGGILLNLKLVRVDGREIDWPTAIVRALSCFLSFVVAGLGFIWIAIDPDRQGWHDKIAGTAVVRVPKGRSLV